MTEDKKKLFIYGGSVAALSLVVYFVLFNKKFQDKLKPKTNPAPNPVTNNNQVIDISSDYPDYPSVVTTRSGTRLRKDPNTSSTILKTYNAGIDLHPDNTSDMEDGLWYHVSEGGWVRSDVVNE